MERTTKVLQAYRNVPRNQAILQLKIRMDKQETYSVEAFNADLRHYFKRLARKSKYFSRRMQALTKNI